MSLKPPGSPGLWVSPDDRVQISFKRRRGVGESIRALLRKGPAEPLDRHGGNPPEPPRRPPPPRRSGGRGSPGGQRRWLSRIVGWGLTAAIWATIAGGAVVAYYAFDLPDLESLTAVSRRPSITLLSADGETVAAYGDVYGEPVTLKDIPASLPEAVMATEDRHFYHHFGLDPLGLARALLANLRAGHVVQGGSTITQQLAKNLFLTPERSIKRKVQELLMALWLERKFSKDQILALYLNRVYLGSGIWGVDAAARRYFDVPAGRLTLYQSALLAGLLKAPSRYNPQNDPELSVARTTQVLSNMVAAGYITPADADAALKTGPQTVKRVSLAGRYFADWIHDQVEQYAQQGRDLIVQTTLDMALQRKVESELAAVLAGPGVKAGVSQGAMVVMSPNGAVRAMAGGRDYATSQFNRAVQGMRQPGSAFKAFLYLAAVEAGWDENDTIDDAPFTTGKYRPENYTGKYEGVISLRHALAKSSNVAAVRLIEMVGPKRVAAVARRLGISSELHPEASLALGTSEVSLLEVTAGYATFANDGNGVFPYGFQQIRDGRGDVVYQRQGTGIGQVVGPHALREMNDMMTAVVETGTGRAAAIDRPVAGKTGTSQDYRDAWFIGFSADYVAGAWFGNDDGTPMHRITGGTLPTQLWHNVMLAAHKGLPVRPLPGLTPEEAPVAAARGGIPAPRPPEMLDNIWHGIVKLFGGG
jgi:penicillin-binding protein 1A